MAVAIHTVKFWINAFIPRDVPGYTKPVPGGPHRGLTMIPGPFPQSDCFLTDQRGFSNAIHAKSRMHAEFRLAVASRPPVLTQWHNCDETTEVDCGDGDVECHKKGSSDRMRFVVLPSRVSMPTGPIEIEMACAANNPCSPSSRFGGDIDMHGRIVVNPYARSIEFDIVIDQFPAFEAYATINDGAGVTMLQEAPPRGNTVMNLPGGANRRVKRRLEDRNGDGIFETLTTL
jgi:hypothetical protein